MNGQKMLVCVEAGLGITEGQEFPVLGENGSVWEILLGGAYRKVNKRSGRVQGWKTGPRFEPESNNPIAGLCVKSSQRETSNSV